MPDWPAPGGSRYEIAGFGSSSTGIAVAAAGSANTKGAWVQLLAATARQAEEVDLIIQINAGTLLSWLVDFGIGANPNEQAIVQNLLVCRAVDQRCVHLRLPLRIPAGSRLSARSQCNVASGTVNCSAQLHAPGTLSPPGAGRIDAHGALTASSRGTIIDGGGTANTKGAWAVLDTATGYDYRALGLMFAHGLNATRAVQCNFRVDIGVGPAGQEQVILPDLIVCASPDLAATPPALGPFPVLLPEGSRLVARCACSNATANDRVLDVAAYGVPF